MIYQRVNIPIAKQAMARHLTTKQLQEFERLAEKEGYTAGSKVAELILDDLANARHQMTDKEKDALERNMALMIRVYRKMQRRTKTK